MAALLEKVRDHRNYPVLTEAERIAQFGSHAPQRLRASLSSSPRHASRPPQVDNYSDDSADVQLIPNNPEEEGLTAGRRPRASLTRRNNGGIIPSRSGSQNVSSSPQTKSSVRNAVFGTLSATLTILFVLYTIVFLIVAGTITIGNSWQYGQNHTTSLQALIHGTPTTIVTSNINHTIYVTIISRDSTPKTYTGTVLDPQAWGGDPSSVVATASVVGKGQTPTIIVSLIGNVNYFRPLFTRPQATFSLIFDDKQAGYKVV